MRFHTNIGYENSKIWDWIRKKIGKSLCSAAYIDEGGGCSTLFKMGLRGKMVHVCYFVKIETVFGCRNSNNLLIRQDLFFRKCIFLRQLE